MQKVGCSVEGTGKSGMGHRYRVDVCFLGGLVSRCEVAVLSVFLRSWLWDL